VQVDGCPTLRASRGKILFALDNTDVHRTQYLAARRASRQPPSSK
jgi:hypothetical protein